MTLVVLASLGVYALRAAATEVRTSGYERQNAQAYYLAEFGVLGVTQDISGTKADLYRGLLQTPSSTTNPCMSVPTVTSVTTTIAGCLRMSASTVQTLAAWSTTPAIDTTSLGPFPLQGDFFVEVSDVAKGPQLAGYGSAGTVGGGASQCFLKFTLTAYGLVQPQNPSSDTEKFGSQAQSMSRAYIRGGPARCP